MLDLVADVGNTRVKLALFETPESGSGASGSGDLGSGVAARLVARASISYDDPFDSAADAFLGGRVPARWLGVSVSPERAARVSAWAKERGADLRWLGVELPFPAALGIKPGCGVGADRVANAAWAAASYPGQGVVLFDLGTAITLDAVDAQGRFRGGAIAAGVALRARALHEHTALLPEVSLGGEVPPALGSTTLECLQGGLFWGTVGLVSALTQEARRELGDPQAPLVLTGGDAARVGPACGGPVRVCVEATLRGVLVAACSVS